MVEREYPPEGKGAVHHPVFAYYYTRVASVLEQAGGADHRTEVLAGLSGRVIEVGAGTGLNFAHYPESVTEVVAVEPESRLRKVAESETAHAAVAVRVINGLAENLPCADGEFDAGVAALVLCSVVDPRRALAELRRVIRPGGELRFYEHVQSDDPRAARWQNRVNTVWPLLAGGCQTNRRTVPTIIEAGFDLQDIRRFQFRPSLLCAPIAPFVIGRAIRA
jgi:ubiquinone/menaquinone biosynthesis C-methylase UbiE